MTNKSDRLPTLEALRRVMTESVSVALQTSFESRLASKLLSDHVALYTRVFREENERLRKGIEGILLSRKEFPDYQFRNALDDLQHLLDNEIKLVEYTRANIALMSPEEFKEHEEAIAEAMMLGAIT